MLHNRNVYVQIKEKYEHLIKLGVFKSGEMLPSLRSVALELGVNPNTVEKAFQLLADDGLVEIHYKKGAVVKAAEKNDLRTVLKSVIEPLSDSYSDQEIMDMVKKILEKRHD